VAAPATTGSAPVASAVAPAVKTAAEPAPTPAPALSEPLQLFERLVTMTRRYHVFAPQTEKNLGRKWDDYLPKLRAEFAAAKTRDDVELALWHFGNSLHDVHCQFRAKNRGDRLRLGVRVGVEAKGEGFVYTVEKVMDEALAKELAPGDVIVSVDGVPAERLLEEHELASNMNSRENVANDVAQYLSFRRTSTTNARAGTTSTWVVRPRAGGAPKTVTATWKVKKSSDDGDDFALDYANADCVNGDPKTYGPYTMTARGYRVCVYTSTAPKYRDYPIVRHVSFRYDEIPHGPLADYDVIKRALASTKPKGVVLDVSENGGGINPNLFIEWWSDKPYTDTETRMVLDPDLLKDERGEAHISSINGPIREWYAAELAKAGGRRVSSPRPFMCKPDTCAWDNKYAPKHRVTTAPVALVLGPGCASSCDALAWHFAEQKIGPIVGRPAMAGFTTHRARFEVGPGTIDFAISYDTRAGGTESIEGVAVPLDAPVPRTFENASKHDQLLVDAAIAELTKRR
jgi:C-terminal processing protease CtpA/Prc